MQMVLMNINAFSSIIYIHKAKASLMQPQCTDPIRTVFQQMIEMFLIFYDDPFFHQSMDRLHDLR